MSLEQWRRNTWLQEAEATLPEIQQLFQVVDREISDAGIHGLSAEGRFQHAYNAALQLCMIALRASGYRVPKGEGHHKRAIESLQLTLGGSWSHEAEHIERCSRLRGHAMYERSGVVSRQDAEDLLETAKKLRGDVLQWLKANHPELVPPGL